MRDIIPLKKLTEMGANDFNSSAPAAALSCEPRELMPSLFGETTSTTRSPRKKGSNALSSATKAPSRPLSFSDRLTPSLITAGLVKGITPRSIRKKLGAVILDGALFEPAGEDAA